MAINRQAFESELSRVFKLNGLGSLLDKRRSELFFLLTERMLTENEKYNLTAITEPEKIILNHYADCALLSAKLPKGAKIIDVGCGAGFPTHVKLNVPKDKKVDTLIINAAECEPYITVDYREALDNSWDVVSGVYTIAELLQVENVIIAVEDVALFIIASITFC